MNKKHVYTNIAWWGREREDACLEHGYRTIHVIHLYKCILIMNLVVISNLVENLSQRVLYKIVRGMFPNMIFSRKS